MQLRVSLYQEINGDLHEYCRIHDCTVIDNKAAKAFADESCFKSKLKHIDNRQTWVKILRDKKICKTVSVDTKENIADLFTKILQVSMREMMSAQPHPPSNK